MTFGPKNEAEEIIFAAEGLRVDVQHRISTLMNERGISGKDLAHRMGRSEDFADYIFEDETDLTVRELGVIIHGLGVSLSEFVRPWVQRDSEIARLAADVAEAQHRLDLLADRVAAVAISAGTRLSDCSDYRDEPTSDTEIDLSSKREKITRVSRVARTEISLPSEDDED